MATSRHTIELNGQLYDAVTGALVKAKAGASPKVMDGFTKRKVSDAALPVLPAEHRAPVKKHRVDIQTSRPAPKPAKRSATLMRTAVKKPTPLTKQAAIGPEIKKASALPARRLHNASSSQKSQLISRFGNTKRAALEAKVASVPVAAPPIINARPLADLHQQIAAVTGMTAPTKRSFEHAIEAADSHKQPKIKKAKLSHRVAAKTRLSPKLVNLGSALAAVLLLGGFFLYQNIPQLSMRVAAARAGVAADLPTYRPAGFSMSRHISYSPGAITVSYQSNSDDRAFRLTQMKTTLSDEDLAAKLAGDTAAPYQTYQDNDRTIYIYDGSNAAWLDEGILYEITGKSSLNSDQLIRLATSI